MKDRSVRRAIMLLAGRGRRLGDLSEAKPKCLVEIGGEPILYRSLRALSACGIDELVFVVGYKHWMIREAVETEFPDLAVRYVRNDQYATTNTAYSLWLARAFFDDSLLLVEGDIVFDAAMVGGLIRAAGRSSAWAAVPVGRDRDEGILLERGLGGRVGRVERITDRATRPASLAWKCGGLQLLSLALAEAMAGGLDDTYRMDHKQIFADLVLARFLSDHVITVCPVDPDQWAEIDDARDLEGARSLWTQERARSA